jgi:hypothetical protein
MTIGAGLYDKKTDKTEVWPLNRQWITNKRGIYEPKSIWDNLHFQWANQETTPPTNSSNHKTTVLSAIQHNHAEQNAKTIYPKSKEINNFQEDYQQKFR